MGPVVFEGWIWERLGVAVAVEFVQQVVLRRIFCIVDAQTRERELLCVAIVALRLYCQRAP
jgi:hypothetical protein